MSDPASIYPRIQTGYAYTIDMNDEFIEIFKSSTFIQGSAISKTKYHNPKKLVVQHLTVKERVKKIKIDCMGNGYILDTLTSVDIQEIVKIVGKVIGIYEGVIYHENCKVSPPKKSN